MMTQIQKLSQAYLNFGDKSYQLSDPLGPKKQTSKQLMK